MDAQAVRRAAVLCLLSHAYLLSGHPTAWQPQFLPGPQFCPDTGRTVCTTVDYYPTDHIHHLLTNARSQVFNLTSLFVDERKGDVEPNIAQLPTQPPYRQDGYGGDHQPPPGGRFSPAGRPWNTPQPPPPSVNDRAPPSEYPQDRWRLVEPSYQQGPPNAQPYNANNGRQSRAHPPNQRRDPANAWRVSSPRPHQGGAAYNNDNSGRGIAQHNRNQIESHTKISNFDSQQHYGRNNLSGYFPQQQIPVEPFQIQPPYTQQQNIKGYGPTLRPSVDGNWKGSPNYGNQGGNPQGFQGPPHRNQPRFNTGKRQKRNQDVEVACQVQSTYVPPRAALNDNSEWKFIINVPERDRRFSQVVRVDVCLTEGQACSSRLSLPFGFESRCRQKYIKKKLLSLNPDGQGTSEDNFFIPSCCVCEITRSTRK